MSLHRFLARRLFAALVSTHLGGALLLALALAVEAADRPLPVLVQQLAERLPDLYTHAAAVLTLAGAAWAAFGLRRDRSLLALGTFGASPRRVLLVAAVLGALLGAATLTLPAAAPPSVLPDAWLRLHEGWRRADGTVFPDAPGGVPIPFDVPAHVPAERVLDGATAGALGAGLGLYAEAGATLLAAAVMLLFQAIIAGLVARGALPAAGLALPGVLAVTVLAAVLARAPLFPRHR